MNKTFKLLTVFSAAAVMTAVTPDFLSLIPGVSSEALAAVKPGWTEEDGELRYRDSDGYYLTDSWKKKDGDWYYLNEEGFLTRSAMVDEYFVDENGKRISNRWISISNEEDWDDEAPETYWYYYGKDGRQVVSRWQSIDENYYYFNEDGHMQTGKLELDGFTYYLGDENDGIMKTGWIQLENESDDPDEELVWHYFDKSGKMVMNQIDRKIDGNYYTFENGVMQTGWYRLPEVSAKEQPSETEITSDSAGNAASDSTTATASNAEPASADDANTETDTLADDHSSQEGAQAAAEAHPEIASYRYYEADGKRANGWYQMEGAPGISEEGETFIFYIKNGKPHHAHTGVQVFTIDSKRYGFNTHGELQTGLQTVTLEDGGTANYYFGADGVMKTGKQTIYNEDLDENQTWFFLTDGGSKGQGFHGIRDNSVYRYGQRLDADRDLRFAPVELNGVSYLVNTAGSIQKAASSSKSAARPELGNGFKDIKDANDKIWTVDTNGVIRN